MTIRELVEQDGTKVFAVCMTCVTRKRPFHMRIENPKEEDILRVQYRANRHDRNGRHDVLITLPSRLENLKK